MANAEEPPFLQLEPSKAARKRCPGNHQKRHSLHGLGDGIEFSVGLATTRVSGWTPANLVDNAGLPRHNVGPAGNGCAIDGHGDLFCTGSKPAVVPVEHGQKMVALYAVEAPENWFEDFGSGQLANGVATVSLEPMYAHSVNTSIEYHVFLTPKDDCNGLYVTNETAASFEVRELHGGHSSIAFDYRIVAKRTGYEQIRLADKTKMIKDIARLAASRRRPNPDTGAKQIAPLPHR